MSKSPTVNEIVATGRGFIDYDPVGVLLELRDAIGYRDGYVINLGASADSYLMRRILNCIAFHTGGDTKMNPKESP